MIAPIIRQIREEDIASFREAIDVVAREKRFLYFTEAPPLAAVAEHVRKRLADGSPLLVLAANGGIAGWCNIFPAEHGVRAHVGVVAMGLRPSWRDQGWGTRLMQQALAAGDAFGYRRIELTVYASNPRAAALYRKCGFIEEGIKRQSVLIDGRYFDEIIMARLQA